jgi:hypothetical protein
VCGHIETQRGKARQGIVRHCKVKKARQFMSWQGIARQCNLFKEGKVNHGMAW